MALIEPGMKERREIPHEPGQWMEFRYLNWSETKEMRQTSVARSMNDYAATFAGVNQEVMTSLLKMRAEAQATVTAPNVEATEAAAVDPTVGLDRGVVLDLCICGWSYPDICNPESIAKLDEPTAEWAFREAIAVNTPKPAVARKNGSHS